MIHIKLTSVLLLFSIHFLSLSQSSWEEVQKNKKGSINIIYFNAEPFCYEEKGKLKGTEYELMQNFASFVEKNYEVELKVNFIEERQFGRMYQLTKDGKPGTFGIGSLSITQSRLKEIQFSPSYFPDIEVLITSPNVPIAHDTIEFQQVFKNLKAISLSGTTIRHNLETLKPLLPNMTIESMDNFNEIVQRISQSTNLFSYAQLSSYLIIKKQGVNIKRQNLFKLEKEGGHGVAYPLKSDWTAPMEAYFSGSAFKSQNAKTLAKYLGSDVNEIILELASTQNNKGDDVTLLNKELEFQNLQLQKHKLEIGQQELIRNLVIAGIVFTLFIIGILARSSLLQRKNNKLLQKKNDEIGKQRKELIIQTKELKQLQKETISQRDFIENTNKELRFQSKQLNDSIYAAQTIQQALLPYDERMGKSFEDFFVIFRPRDIVSGDFYWLDNKDKTRILAAIDCTGHGIPGAFMSMIGNTLFDKAVQASESNDPSQILNAVDEDIRRVLIQDQNTEVGMDAALIVLEDLENKQVKLKFCGAKRPLYYYQESSSHIEILRGDRKSLGGLRGANLSFKTKEVTLPKGSVLYFGSDGLTDQNNAKRERYGKKRLLNMLRGNMSLPLQMQKEALEASLDNFQRDTKQRDDIVFIGVKV